MRAKLFGTILVTAAVIIAASGQVKAATVDSSRDCDEYAIVHCGTMSPAEARSKYSEGDTERVFKAFGINRSDITNDLREGVVYKDGRIIVDGKTVATDARMAARNLGGTPIEGTSANQLSVSNMESAQTAMVKLDANGEFLFAIMKPCGNPVIATPKPQPKPSAECKTLTVTPISRTHYKLTATGGVHKGATISGYTYTVKNGAGAIVDTRVIPSTHPASAYTTVQTTPGTYTASVSMNTSLGAITSPGCAISFTVPPEPTQPVFTCDALEVKKLSRTEYSFKTTYSLTDASLKSITYVIKDSQNREISRSTDTTYTLENPGTYSVQAFLAVTVDGTEQQVTSESCKATLEVTIEETPPCPIEGKEHLPIDSPECKEAPIVQPEIPTSLPETGVLGTVSSFIGLGAIITSSGYYLASRRHLGAN